MDDIAELGVVNTGPNGDVVLPFPRLQDGNLERNVERVLWHDKNLAHADYCVNKNFRARLAE